MAEQALAFSGDEATTPAGTTSVESPMTTPMTARISSAVAQNRCLIDPSCPMTHAQTCRQAEEIETETETESDNSNDVAPLEELLRSPQNAMRQLVEEFKMLEESDVSVDTLIVFRLSRAFGHADQDFKEELVMRLVIDFMDMDVAQRVEATRFSLRILALSQQPGCSAAFRFWHVLKPEANVSPFILNVMKVFSQSGCDLQDIMQSRWPLATEALHTLLELGPCRLIHSMSEIVYALTTDERQQLITIIVDWAGLGKDLRRLLEKTMMPAGYVDNCVPAMNFLSTWGLTCCAVPFMELFLSFFMPTHPNGSLIIWLRCDSIHWIIAIIAAYVLKVSGEALVVEKFDEFSQIHNEGNHSVTAAAEATTENSSSSTEKRNWTRAYKLSVTCAVAAIVLLVALLIGAFGGLVAGCELLYGFFVAWHGSVSTYVLCLGFDILRIGLTATMLYAAYIPVNDVWTLYQAAESETQCLTVSKDLHYGSGA